MYHFSLGNNTPDFASFFHSVGDEAFCLLTEAFDWHANELTELQRVHRNAFRQLDTDIPVSEVPLNYALALDSILKESNQGKDRARSLGFTGVACINERIFVCTAGVTRAHLIKDGKLVNVTRDHNMVQDIGDGVEGLSLDVVYEVNPVVFFSRTRALGLEGTNKPPESVSWGAGTDYTILICSERYHHFRDPAEYMESFISGENLSLMPHDTNPPGILAKIEYKKD